MELLKYKYYDSPEGQDCFGKIFYLSKWSAYCGLTVAVTDVLLISHTKGYAQTAGRIAYFVGPFAAMAASFAATACIANSIRGKDDYKNYVAGALSSASIYGAWRKNLGSGIRAGILMSIVAYWQKWNIENGTCFFPYTRQEKVLMDLRHIDYSGLKGKYD